MTNYKFPTRIRGIERIEGPRIDVEIPEPEEERGEIAGRQAASFAEWVVALALWYLKLRFTYKKSIPKTKYSVDFYIEAAPQWVMLDVWTVAGDRNNSSRRFRKKVIERVMGRPLHTLWSSQVSTYEEAIGQIRRLVN